ncbi:sugar transferase [Sphingobium aromaticiconvertens]|uniref:sugar transferase n=1 Tax=Sphingobium aromaticiconvertens TaxID=365341 RepID=UPI0030188D28
MPTTETAKLSTATSKRLFRLHSYVGLMLLDCALIVMTFLVVEGLAVNSLTSLHGVNVAAMVILIYLCIAINGQAYSLEALQFPNVAGGKALIHMILTMLASHSFLYFAHVGDQISRLPFTISIVISAFLLAAARRPYASYVLRIARGDLTNDLLIKDGVAFEAQPHAHVVDAVEAHLQPDLNDPYMLHRLGCWLQSFDRVVIACPAENAAQWRLLLQGANIQGEIIIPGIDLSGVIGVGSFENRSTQIVSKGPLSMANRAQKRIFDLAITAPALILLAPLMLIVAIAIKLESPGPVFFLQDRVGRGNRLFKIMKFRSMRDDLTDHSGAISASRDDLRITKVGAIIRRTSIDELPQLINVLRGDMSLVGPRPHALGSTAGNKPFWEVSQLYWCRHSLKPGITGLAQVRGFRGATEQAQDLENRLRADLEYIQNWSFMREVLILLGTLRVLVHKNAF